LGVKDDAMVRALIVVAVVGLIALAIWHPAPQAPVSTASLPTAATEPARRHMKHALPSAAGEKVVYVVGAVIRPGLYHIAENARIDDAVRAAGGFRAGADPAGVNLAAHASDGDEIDVPLLGESARPTSSTKRSRTPRARITKTHAIVNVNTASVDALASVPGIGATVAARIVEIRERDGAFTSFDELLDVAGVTQSRLDRALPFLHL
jgi:competence protein ComEA